VRGGGRDRQDGEDFDGTVFGGWRGVFDWHRDDWWLTQSGVKILRITSRIADLQQRYRRDADEPAFDATSPCVGLRAASEPDQRRLVDGQADGSLAAVTTKPGA